MYWLKAYRHWRPSPFFLASILLTCSAPFLLLIYPAGWRWVLSAVLIDHLIMTIAGLLPRCAWLGSNWRQLPADAIARNEVAITIDDGPDPQVTPLVLEVLDRYQAKATFFCIGDQAARYPELCRQIVERGHAVENHSQHHRYHYPFFLLGGWLKELQNAQQTLTAITGIKPLFFRPPVGLRNPLLDPVLSRLGMQLVSWTRRGFDTVESNPDKVLTKLLNGLKAGDILLLHDGKAGRAADGTPIIVLVLPRLLEALEQANMRSVTLRSALM